MRRSFGNWLRKNIWQDTYSSIHAAEERLTLKDTAWVLLIQGEQLPGCISNTGQNRGLSVQVHIDRIENNNQIERELTHSQFFDRVSMSMLLLKPCLLPPLHIWAWISRIVNSLGNSKKTDCYLTKQISLDTRSTFSKSYYNSTRTHKDMCIRNKLADVLKNK